MMNINVAFPELRIFHLVVLAHGYFLCKHANSEGAHKSEEEKMTCLHTLLRPLRLCTRLTRISVTTFSKMDKATREQKHGEESFEKDVKEFDPETLRRHALDH